MSSTKPKAKRDELSCPCSAAVTQGEELHGERGEPLIFPGKLRGEMTSPKSGARLLEMLTKSARKLVQSGECSRVPTV